MITVELLSPRLEAKPADQPMIVLGGEIGPPGPAGATGPTGPAGPAGLLPTSTWAGLPGAGTVTVGQRYRVTDFGVAGVGLLVVSDGTRWLPDGPQILAASAVAASVTGTTAETALTTCAVPAGSLGLSGGLRVIYNVSYTANANAKLLKLKLGATTLRSSSRSTPGPDSFTDIVRNRGSASSQYIQLTLLAAAATSSSQATSAENTTPQIDLVITVQLAVGTDTLVLQNYEVWLLP